MRRAVRLRKRPRALLVGLCLTLLAAGLAGGVAVWAAHRWTGTVTVLGNWTGDERQRFEQRVLARFEEKYRIDVVYQGSSAESQVLAADVESGTQPDVALLPGPGELAAYAAQGLLRPLDGLFDPGAFDDTWAPQVGGTTYWVPVKADLKSMVWHPRSLTRDQVVRAAEDPGAWCLAMESGATSGWPGTDWVEDILLQQAGWKEYEKWAAGDVAWDKGPVRTAWETWNTMIGASRNPGAAAEALGTNYQQACGGGRRLEHQSGFARTLAQWKDGKGDYVHSSAVIPKARTGDAAWEVSGDLAAMLRPTPEARRLIRYLASAEGQEEMGTAQGGFSANKQVPVATYGKDPRARTIAGTLRDPRTRRCWDASDAMPPAMRDAFQQAVLRFLASPGDRTLDSVLGALEQMRKSLKSGTAKTAWLQGVCGGG